MSELARSPIRYEVSLPVRFRAEGELSWTAGALANLSVSGLCLLSAEADLIPGQSVELVIETTDKFLRLVSRRIRARVVWAQGGRYGVQFAKQTRDPFAGLVRKE